MIPGKATPEGTAAYAKAHPGAINFASPGIGTPPHLAGELFKTMVGVDIIHVPFREANAAIAGLNGTALGGRQLTVNEARAREGDERPRRPPQERRPRW